MSQIKGGTIKSLFEIEVAKIRGGLRLEKKITVDRTVAKFEKLCAEKELARAVAQWDRRQSHLGDPPPRRGSILGRAKFYSGPCSYAG